ncbi:12307_t:CDS:2, partial [Rhizophagus irregularis]
NNTTVQKERRFNPNFGGNHRKSLVENLDGSLKRLNMSYVDILYVHVYEYRTPIEEFMRSLDDVVRSGKVLYVAVSDIPSWALSRANTMAELRGWSPFIGLQTRYNLLDRSLEFDLQPACAELGVGILPWSIVADGFLTGKYKRETNINLKSDYRNRSIINYSKDEKNWQILDEVIAISKEINRSPVQIALNWIQQKPGITSPLIGARTVAQLEENLKSLEFKLTPEQMKRLDDVSQPTGREVPFPHSMTDSFDGFIGKNMQVPNKFAPIATTYNYGRLY